jgi:glyoxylase-like metal-dependent hydrolase (beta-lactamase superfamily II)
MTAPEVHPIVDEGLGNSSYLVDLGDGRALVVDPVRDPSSYLELAGRRRLTHAVETHLHADFVSGSRELAATIGRRVLPELSKAFAYRASRFEGFKIACYQASDGGFFGAHRDNLSPATAHRRFALTLNLNDGYQGGQLRFPEYGPELYRPAPALRCCSAARTCTRSWT